MVKNLALVSLSCGLLGEESLRHEIQPGLQRLKDMGLSIKIMPHAMKGIQYTEEHPEDRAQDLLDAFADGNTDMILCAIGGDDTYRLSPWLFDHDELKKVISNKIFLGFSDTTINHLMLHKMGLNTFYGQAFIPDICELAKDMLPYTRRYFEELITTGRIAEIRPSDVWYEERTDFGPDAVGTDRISHENHGFELLQGNPVFSGKILGGCIESMCDLFCTDRYPDTAEKNERYQLFPPTEDWKGRILLLETSEEQPEPEYYRRMIRMLKERGIFDAVNGVLCGKPMDEKYDTEYRKIIVEEVNDPELPILANINVGHATPRCIIPMGVPATVDAKEQVIRFRYE